MFCKHVSSGIILNSFTLVKKKDKLQSIAALRQSAERQKIRILKIVILFLNMSFIWLCWSLLQHVRSVVMACKLLAVACGIQFPDQRQNPGRLNWEHGVLATKPPRNSLKIVILNLQKERNQKGLLIIFLQQESSISISDEVAATLQTDSQNRSQSPVRKKWFCWMFSA